MDSESDSNKHKPSFSERFGIGAVEYILMEFAFWIVIGLVWLAYSGGIWGKAMAFISGVFFALIWWANQPSNNQPQSHEHDD